MSLVDTPRPPPTGPRVRILPTLLASAVAVFVFVVVLSVVARATADDALYAPSFLVDAGVTDAGAEIVDAGDVVDAGEFLDGGGVDGGVSDGGVVDGGPPPELFTVSIDAGPDVDGGPAEVEGPPYDVDAVMIVATVLVEACAKDGLRWDPSLGGAFTLKVTLPEASSTPRPAIVEADGLRSPVVSSCLQRRAPTLTWPAGATDLLVPQQVVASASLSTAGLVKVEAIQIRAMPTSGD